MNHPPHRGPPGVWAKWCGCNSCWEETKRQYPGYRLVETDADFAELLLEIEQCEFLSFDYETFQDVNPHWLNIPEGKKRPFDMHNTTIACGQFSTKVGTAWYVSCAHAGDSPNRPISDIALALSRKPVGAPLIAHNAVYEQSVSMTCLYDYQVHKPWKRQFMPGPIHDTMIMAFIENENQWVNLKNLSKTKLGFTQLNYSYVLAQCNAKDMRDLTAREGFLYGCMDPDQTLALYIHLKAKLEKMGLWKNCVLDFNMNPIISKLQLGGVNIDLQELNTQTLANTCKMQELEDTIQAMALEAVQEKAAEKGIAIPEDYPLSLSSPKQVGKLLYHELDLPIMVRNKPTEKMKARGQTEGNPSTNSEALVYLQDHHAIAAELFNYRDYEQRNKMFYKSYPALWHPDTGRLHGSPRLTTNDETGLSTGRMSYSLPNKQQIPKRGEKVIIRKVFIPDEGHDRIASSDQSQVELRVLAWFSRDETLLRCYREGIDVHALTAAGAFNTNIAEVSKEERFVGKTLNFSIIYGAAAFRIMKIVNADARKFGINIRITETEAKRLIQGYFKTYPGVAKFVMNQKQFAFQHAYVLSMFKRRFNLPLIRSRNNFHKSKAERKAVNSPIQGSAAELIKRAAINIDRDPKFQELEEAKLARMLMMIHDEIVFSYDSKIEAELAGVVTKHQETPPNGFDVPLEAGWEVGNNFCDLIKTPRETLLKWKEAA
jgi:DNA polymerase-1